MLVFQILKKKGTKIHCCNKFGVSCEKGTKMVKKVQQERGVWWCPRIHQVVTSSKTRKCRALLKRTKHVTSSHGSHSHTHKDKTKQKNKQKGWQHEITAYEDLHTHKKFSDVIEIHGLRYNIYCYF